MNTNVVFAFLGFRKQLLFPRTTQIVIEDGFGGLVHRLREPWDLHGLPTKRTGQSVCWPQEREVIKERIRHIEGVPLGPEPLYRATGSEEAPICTGAEEGEVVYVTNKADSQPFFTFSRVGGSSQPLTQAAINRDKQDNTLIFEARFECGNLQKVLKVGEHDYNLILRTDLYTARHTQWFYFRVQNTQKAVPYRFTIVNLMKPSSLYNRGMKPLMYSAKDAEGDGLGWRRVGTHIKYYKNNRGNERRPFYSLSWTFQFPHDSDTCYFAHCYPYSYSDLQDYLIDVAADPVKSKFCKVRVLCRSLAGNMVYLLTVTNPSQSPEVAAGKRAVILTARVHPGESNSSWMMKGFLDHLLGGSADAGLLRDTFLFKIVPMLNPDGVIVGNSRCSLSGRDLNRQYRSFRKELYPPAWYTWRLIKRLVEDREVLLYCDFHGHSRKQNIFMYGCQGHGTVSTCVKQRVFPLMLSKNCSDKFSFRSCKFHMKREKEGTGRVVAWRLGVANSYTLEATFCGSTLGNKGNVHFNVRDLEAMGFQFCDTLLDYCDPDQSKYIQCIEQLKSQIKEDIAAKMGISDAEYDSDTPLSDILSCIESSSTGSNSSESNEPPLNLVNKEHAEFSRKDLGKRKKQLKTKRERENSYLMRKAMDTERHHQFTSQARPAKVPAETHEEKCQGRIPYQNGSDPVDTNVKVPDRTSEGSPPNDHGSGRLRVEQQHSTKKFTWVPKTNSTRRRTTYFTPHLMVSPVHFFPVSKTKLPVIDRVESRNWRIPGTKNTIYNVLAVPSSLLTSNGFSTETTSLTVDLQSVLNSAEPPQSRGPDRDTDHQDGPCSASSGVSSSRVGSHQPLSGMQVSRERKPISNRSLRFSEGADNRSGSDQSTIFTHLWKDPSLSELQDASKQMSRAVSHTLSAGSGVFNPSTTVNSAPGVGECREPPAQSRSALAASKPTFCTYLDILDFVCRSEEKAKEKRCSVSPWQQHGAQLLTDPQQGRSSYSLLCGDSVQRQGQKTPLEENPQTSQAKAESSPKTGLKVGEDGMPLRQGVTTQIPGVEGDHGEGNYGSVVDTEESPMHRVPRSTEEKLGVFSLVYREHVRCQHKQDHTPRNSTSTGKPVT